MPRTLKKMRSRPRVGDDDTQSPLLAWLERMTHARYYAPAFRIELDRDATLAAWTDWSREGREGEQRAEAAQRVGAWYEAGDPERPLDLSGLDLDSLPALPRELRRLDAGNNNLAVLPALPPYLEVLDVNTNLFLERLPPLPATLRELRANTNALKRFEAPELPALDYVDLSDNQLEIVPFSFRNARTIILRDNKLTHLAADFYSCFLSGVAPNVGGNPLPEPIMRMLELLGRVPPMFKPYFVHKARLLAQADSNIAGAFEDYGRAMRLIEGAFEQREADAERAQLQTIVLGSLTPAVDRIETQVADYVSYFEETGSALDSADVGTVAGREVMTETSAKTVKRFFDAALQCSHTISTLRATIPSATAIRGVSAELAERFAQALAQYGEKNIRTLEADIRPFLPRNIKLGYE